jgi:hypothetical protein
MGNMNTRMIEGEKAIGLPSGAKGRDAWHKAWYEARFICDMDKPGRWVDLDPEEGFTIFINDTGIDPRMWVTLTPAQRRRVPRKLRPVMSRPSVR